MEATDLNGVPPALWPRAARAPHRLLVLDFDGTLAPFHRDRHAARPLDASIASLRHIARAPHTTVAIVSGRPIAELRRLVGPLPAHLFGEHGWERLHPERGLESSPLPAAARRALDDAEAAARAGGHGELLERKRTALVLHTRALPGDQARAAVAQCAERWGAIAERAGAAARLDWIDGGLELRAGGRDKGTAVRELRSQCPEGTLVVVLGDDVSDEDAFASIGADGFAIRVANPRVDPGGSVITCASGRLPSTAAVAAFLARWLRELGTPPVSRTDD